MKHRVSYTIPLLTIILLMSFLVRIPSFEEPFTTDTGGNAYGAKLITQGEPLYSTFHPGHHMPAVYYTYAFVFKSFGNGHKQVKIFLAFWTVMATFLIYMLGEKLYGSSTGLISASLFGLFSAGVTTEGTSAQIELFANLPIIATMLAFYLSESKNSRCFLPLVGVFGAIAFLFKAVYVMVLLSVTCYLLWELFRSMNISSFRRFVNKNLLIYSGFVMALIPVTMYFYFNGLFSELLSVFTLGASYSGETLYVSRFLYKGFTRTLIEFRENSILWVLTVANIIILFRKGQWHLRSNQLMLLWLLFTIIEVSFSGYFFQHYFLLLIPPMSIFAGDGIVKILKLLKQEGKLLDSIGSLFIVFILASTPILFFAVNYAYYKNYFEYKTGKRSKEVFLGSFVDSPLTTNRIAEYIKMNTKENDYIYVWGYEPYIYYLSETKCPIKHVWPISMGYLDVKKQAQLQRQIFENDTKYIVLLSSSPAWLSKGIDDLYEWKTSIDGKSIYARR